MSRRKHHPKKNTSKTPSSVFHRIMVIFLRRCFLFGVFVFLCFSLVLGSLFLPNQNTSVKVIWIMPGSSTYRIAQTLETEGVLFSWIPFSVGGYFLKMIGYPLKSGEYEIPPAHRGYDVLRLLLSGKTLVHKITFPEGITTKQLLKKIKDTAPLLVWDLVDSPEFHEGAFLPETYFYHRGKKASKLLDEMKKAQDKVLSELWSRRGPGFLLKTPLEAVTLASIVEKETALGEERPLIAGVFLNRLRIKMRLQSDPTVIYGLSQGDGYLDRLLTKADLAAETPYNTYRIPALPRGPIGNPGIQSLKAVFSPQVTPFLYFVANGKGGHVFASSLEEHLKNVEKWRAFTSFRATP